MIKLRFYLRDSFYATKREYGYLGPTGLSSKACMELCRYSVFDFCRRFLNAKPGSELTVYVEPDKDGEFYISTSTPIRFWGADGGLRGASRRGMLGSTWKPAMRLLGAEGKSRSPRFNLYFESEWETLDKG
jgi:hypothetical protein